MSIARGNNPQPTAKPDKRGRIGMLKKTAVAVSAAINVIVIVGAAWLVSGGYVSLARQFIVEPHYERSVTQFEELPVRPHDIVFLGDSLTEFGTWDELFAGTNIRNRGISGDDSGGVLARVDEVAAGKPGQVFLMIGTNDLTNGDGEAEIVDNVEEIVARIKSHSPGTEIFLQSVLPRGANYRDEVESLNRNLHAAAAGAATWIDLYPHFLDRDGSIADRYSNDELHLFGDGYLVWRDVIQPYVDNKPA